MKNKYFCPSCQIYQVRLFDDTVYSCLNDDCMELWNEKELKENFPNREIDKQYREEKEKNKIAFREMLKKESKNRNKS